MSSVLGTESESCLEEVTVGEQVLSTVHVVFLVVIIHTCMYMHVWPHTDGKTVCTGGCITISS